MRRTLPILVAALALALPLQGSAHAALLTSLRFVTPTASVAMVALPASFGPSNYDVRGPLVLADDGVGTGSDACEPIRNIAPGTVVLVDRGTCSFVQKATNVEQAGGIGMIVADNVEGVTPKPGPAGAPVRIPVAAISRNAGNAVKNLLRGTVLVEMVNLASTDLDGDGVPDDLDTCPTQPGTADNGCPMPTSKDQCKGSGWQAYGTTFRNQGHCVRFVETGKR